MTIHPQPSAVRSHLQARRFGVRCGRCARTQPPLPPGVYQCVYCGTGLPLQRWMAHPPPSALTPAVPRKLPRLTLPYQGPPSYGGGHPRWGFAPTVWHWQRVKATTVDKPPIFGLRSAAFVAGATAIAALAAAAAETWRFTLMLRGRTEVLQGSQVQTSDLLVSFTAWVTLALAMITAVFAVPVLVSAHEAAARQVGRTPARRPLSVWLRLVVPIWNAWGAGQMLAEIEGTLAQRTSVARRLHPVIRWWWLMWIVSTALAIAAIARAFGGGLQAIADTVELHIAANLAAAVVAALSVAVLLRLARLFAGPKPGPYQRWRVATPEPTRPRLADADAAAARRHSGVVPGSDLRDGQDDGFARPVTVPAGADVVIDRVSESAESADT